MCGIAGIFQSEHDARINPASIRAMCDTLRHRGPDADGVYTAEGIGLGHRRLSIIDLEGGRQPLCNEDQSIWIVFNGEIYNFEELNRTYLSSGHSFRTRSDTETIVHLYEELGEESFSRLRGMFAFALWDTPRRKLLLVRDRLGKKPLFYSWNGRRLIFASEIKALLTQRDVPKEIDITAVSDYFSFQYVPAPKTIYRDIRKLRPAHYLSISGTQLREVPYWDIRFDIEEDLTEGEWCERFLYEYKIAIKSRLISDVPLGAFLSGGVDSSSVVSVMNEFQSPVTTCSIGFPVQGYDEAVDARNFAHKLGANHNEATIKPQAVDLVPTLAWHYDEPFADSSAIPTYYVSQIARQCVKVALSGDGGDENFAGYRRYRLAMNEDRVRSLLPPALRHALFGPLGRWYPKLGWAPRCFRGKSTFESLARTPLAGYFYGISCCPPPLKPRLFAEDLNKALAGYDSIDVLQEHYQRADTADPLSRIQYVDMKTYLVDDILVKVDRASMAHSLEVRCPLLDHKLMELIATIPSNLKLHHGQGKYIFKRALRNVLPSEILNRPKKGFAVPVAEWFRTDLKGFAHNMLFDRQDELLNQVFLSRCWREHQQHHRDWSALLWSVLMFRSWQEVCLAS